MKDKKRIWISQKNEWQSLENTDFLNTQKLEIKEIKDGVILPPRQVDSARDFYAGGVCDKNGKFMAGFSRYSQKDKDFPGHGSINCAYEISESELDFKDEEVIFGGLIHGHFGHFLIDSMGRFWYFLSNLNDTRKLAFITIWENGGGTSKMAV